MTFHEDERLIRNSKYNIEELTTNGQPFEF